MELSLHVITCFLIGTTRYGESRMKTFLVKKLKYSSVVSECDDFIEAARFSYLAYAEKENLAKLAKQEHDELIDLDLVWPVFRHYTDDYKLFHSNEIDADVLVAVSSVP